MSEPLEDSPPAARRRAVEVVVSVLVLLLGSLVVWDSLRVGVRWADDGPQAGYFPFYVGVLLCISGVGTLVAALRDARMAGESFVTIAQLRLVLAVLVPTIVYVAAIGLLGIYVSSVVFIALFMVVLGRYGWMVTAAVSLGVSVSFFLLFEIWFTVPLPKGPLEALLGLA